MNIFKQLLYELQTLCRYSPLYIVKMVESRIEIDKENPLDLSKPIETIQLAEKSLNEYGIFETEHEKKAHNQIDAFIQANPFLKDEILDRRYSIDQRVYSVFCIIRNVKAPDNNANAVGSKPAVNILV